MILHYCRLFFFGALIFFNSCQQAKQKHAGKTSLYKYGIPVSLPLPNDVVFSKSSSGNVESLTMTNNTGFNMQIIMYPASYSDHKKAKFYQRELVVNNPGFKKIVEDYDTGFLFELSLNENIIFDFRFVKIVGNKELVFQAGPTCQCTEADIRNMLGTLH